MSETIRFTCEVGENEPVPEYSIIVSDCQDDTERIEKAVQWALKENRKGRLFSGYAHDIRSLRIILV